MPKPIQHDIAFEARSETLFRKAHFSSPSHPELVSGSMPLGLCSAGCVQPFTAIAAWMLKLVQHDGIVSGVHTHSCGQWEI
jgi:hypothetical protein